jgi:hypothetical protein
VSGTIPAEPNGGLGPRYNSISCGSCHSQPAQGGSSPSSNAFPFIGLQGKSVLVQEATYNGEHLIDQHVKQYQTGKAYSVNVGDGHISFHTFDFDGTNETPSKEHDANLIEKSESTFITGPVSDSFLRANWKQLMSGDTIHVRFGVLELAETVGFKFWKVGERGGLVDIRMKPSSVFIAMAVKSIELMFDPTTHLMMRYLGRTPLRLSDHGKLIPFDGEIVYEPASH